MTPNPEVVNLNSPCVKLDIVVDKTPILNLMSLKVRTTNDVLVKFLRF